MNPQVSNVRRRSGLNRGPSQVTVRMYGTTPLYGPCLVRKFSFGEPKTCRSATRDTGHSQNMAQVRSH
jgi:hypothetical protein